MAHKVSIVINAREAVALYLETLSPDEVRELFEQRDSYYHDRGTGCLNYPASWRRKRKAC